jgi:hypothetical protein
MEGEKDISQPLRPDVGPVNISPDRYGAGDSTDHLTFIGLPVTLITLPSTSIRPPRGLRHERGLRSGRRGRRGQGPTATVSAVARCDVQWILRIRL